MRRLMRRGVLAAALAVLTAAPAHAVPIGQFSWDDCGFFGPCFSVLNSPDESLSGLDPLALTFTNIAVHLTTVDGQALDPIIPGPLFGGGSDGVLAPGDFAQTTDILSAYTLAFATLTFDFGLPGTVRLIDGDTGAVLAGLAGINSLATIDFTPVPEPATLLLMGSGVAIVAARRRKTAGRSGK